MGRTVTNTLEPRYVERARMLMSPTQTPTEQPFVAISTNNAQTILKAVKAKKNLKKMI